MQRYIVYGTCYEKIASLNVEASTSDGAQAAWKKAFEDEGIEGFDVQIWNLDGEHAWLEQQRRKEGCEIWKGNGHKYYFGGYRYSF